jgi:anaerobic selenocysteine-containing dehydrogenase
VDDRILLRELRVARLIATKRGDTERGPLVRIHPEDARKRLLNDGELAWVRGPRRNELATVQLDETLPLGDVVLRDVVGASPSEMVRVIRPELDRRSPRPALG